ncbi:MAG: sulfurtransferase [Caldilineaceae bacterium SB0670_bin_27]|uniref:Sulfurtransferase n=1 Tax=Caldilineaceae bacterium SB0664_bin_27 TaxID=2605260 RepID=A0A6B0YXJ9_9CHLR|nr:sulfurtransferase [Caldilineaceae bacterium]MDE0337349.1 sulfurtransferase [Caldilineaceae bacterium]MXY94905.1 sulfurtransferase [Caldilineaceae bacterium SB0664_bin_27]MYJ78151.1 sulfurtransferase [Caldilineaceae bacterium SB0670_bin_27]
MTDKGYANPDVLVSTEWVAANLNDGNVRLLESNEDVLLYDTGHIPGAQKIDWQDDLNDAVVRDYVGQEQFQALMGKLGISNDTTIVFYGDKSNWWATYAFWVFQLFGHTNAKVMDGGRQKWVDEGRELSTDTPSYPAASYSAPARNDSAIRAMREEVLDHQQAGLPLVDVRSPAEFSGELLHMADYPQEGSLRGGHIAGARNVPWARAANDDGTFKNADDLRAIYEEEQGLSGSDNIVAYCRIGERSSHSWFVLTYLLGYDNVRNYDGSWTEWGNAVGLPIEK